MLPTSTDVFAEFGPSKYRDRARSAALDLVRDSREVRSQLRSECPDSAGVYGMIDCAGRLVYVGMSRCLRKRTLTYFQSVGQGPQRSRTRRKELRVAERARRLVWETTGHELLALLREQELIRRFAPEMNVRGRRRRHLVYVFLSVEEAPRFKVASRLPPACRHYWGPVVRTGGLIRAIEALNRNFQLPDCRPDITMRFQDQAELFELDLAPQCLRGEMNRCMAPCAGMITRARYTAQLRKARAFIEGRDNAPLDKLDRQVEAAVAARRFEYAAVLNRTRTELMELRERLSPRADLLPGSFVYTLQRHGHSYWLAVHEGTIVKVGPAPRDEKSRHVWRRRFAQWQETKTAQIDSREGSELSILNTWFRRRPAELAYVLDFPTVRSMCD